MEIPNSDSTAEMQKQNASSPSQTTEPRLLIVANRLPITIHPQPPHDPTGYTVSTSSGGLVSGLSGLKSTNYLWIGWPGADAPPRLRAALTAQCRESNCHPVYLPQGLIDDYYNGFCNNVLWPLFHYIPPPMDPESSGRTFEQWRAYYRSNEVFVEAILDVYEDGDLVWVHDYHLCLVPKLLRDKRPDAKIGWFLHTPFPSQELFRMLPFRAEILTGLVSANFVAFHVYDYMRHFISSCVHLLGLEGGQRGIDGTPIGGVVVNCATIPIGIEPERFFTKLQDKSVLEGIEKLKAQFAGRKVILGIDRLDYMKGIPHKLNAYDLFLEQNPDYVDHCVLVQLAVPSRTVVPEYQRLKSKVHELVGKINGKRGKLGHVPVHYLDQSLSFDKLLALYRIADVALITSLRDGMNLVAYEYVAAQEGKCGVLILSEFAGAAQSLGAGSIRVNPWNTEETAEAIKVALTMSEEEKKNRHEYSISHVKVHTSQKWAETFIDSLLEASAQSEAARTVSPELLASNFLLEKFEASTRRLIVVELFDSLVPPRGNKGMPMKHFNNLVHLPEAVKNAFIDLTSDVNTTVIITTSHSAATLERLFAGMPVRLAAEKGCLYRNSEGKWLRLVEEENLEFPWMTEVLETLNYFQERTPGSYIEATTASLTWYWEDALPDFGKQQSHDLVVHLLAGPLANTDAEVVLGHRSVEVRSPLCSRENFMAKILEIEYGSSYEDLDFVVCVGSFPWRDEDVYQVFENFKRAEPIKSLSDGGKTGELPSPSTNENENDASVGIVNAEVADISPPPTQKKHRENSCSYFPIGVGLRRSKAKYYLPNVFHVQLLIKRLASRLPSSRVESSLFSSPAPTFSCSLLQPSYVLQPTTECMSLTSRGGGGQQSSIPEGGLQLRYWDINKHPPAADKTCSSSSSRFILPGNHRNKNPPVPYNLYAVSGGVDK